MQEETSKGNAKLLDRFDRFLRGIALWIGGILIFLMVALTVSHVVGRYIFRSPIEGFVDLGQLMLVLVVASAIAYSGRTGGQISVELIDNLVSPAVLKVIEIFVRLAGFAIISVLTIRLYHDGPKAAENGEQTTSLGVSFEPFFYFLATGMALYGLVLIAEAISLFRNRNIGREQALLFESEDDGSL